MFHACDHCGTTVLAGGTKVDDLRYCGTSCAQKDSVGRLARTVPEELVEHAMREVLDGGCPVCDGEGPVDVFTSYRVLSALVVTTWWNVPRVSCRRCATKSQLGSAAFSFVLGWWGGWGLLMTPVQVSRNLKGLVRKPDRGNPSPQLERVVRLQLAEQASRTLASREAA